MADPLKGVGFQPLTGLPLQTAVLKMLNYRPKYMQFQAEINKGRLKRAEVSPLTQC